MSICLPFFFCFVSSLFKNLSCFFFCSLGICSNSFVSFLFFHCCSVKRWIFFISGMYFCYWNSPILQLMIGFCSCSQGKPKSTYCLIVPHLFLIPLTLRAL